MKSFLRNLILSLLAAAANIGFTQELPPVYDWPSLVASAKDHNPDLNASYQDFLATRAEYRASFNGLFPSLSLSSSYSDSSEEGTWGASGSANLDVLNLQTNAAIRSASASLKTSEAGYMSVSSDLRRSLRQSYATLLYAQKQIDVAGKIEEIRRNNADLVELKYESGRESKGNMLRARAELTSARAALSEAKRDVVVARRNLAQDIGKDDSTLSAAGDLYEPNLPDMPSFDEIIARHPQMMAAEAGIRLTEAGLKSAKSSLWPSLSAHYTRSFSGESYFPDDGHWSASGVLSYPLFGGGPTSAFYDIAAAKKNLSSAEESRRSTELEIKANMENVRAVLATRIDQVRVQKEFLEAARQRNEEAQVRYSSGLMSFENWELVVADLVNFEQSAIRALRDAMVAEADWNFSIGKTLED